MASFEADVHSTPPREAASRSPRGSGLDLPARAPTITPARSAPPQPAEGRQHMQVGIAGDQRVCLFRQCEVQERHVVRVAAGRHRPRAGGPAHEFRFDPHMVNFLKKTALRTRH